MPRRPPHVIAQWMSSPSNSNKPAAVGVAQISRPADDQVEHRLRIARRGRHRLEHVDRGGLMFDALAVFAVARGQFVGALRNSPSSRAFSSAMTAWSAKVRTSSICRSVNGCTRCRPRSITPTTARPRAAAARQARCVLPERSQPRAARIPGRRRCRATCTTLPSSATRPATLPRSGDNGSLRA